MDTLPIIGDVKNAIGIYDHSYDPSLKVRITMPNTEYGDKTLEMPDSNFGRGNEISVANKGGKLYHGYDWSVRVAQASGESAEYEDEAELANHFDEFDDSDTFFARRTVSFKLYDTTNTTWKNVKQI